MKFKKSKILTTVFSTILILSSFSLICSAAAYVYLSNGSVSASLEVEKRTMYTNQFNAAIKSWNDTPLPCKAWISTVPGSGHSKVIDDMYADTFRGQYKPDTLQYVFWGRATRFTIRLNCKYLVNDSSPLETQSTIAHEFGHAFCLADNPSPSTPSKSLMNGARANIDIYLPQPDDIDGVINAYK